MPTDWDHAVADIPGLLHGVAEVKVGRTVGWTRPPLPSLPVLNRLLGRARVTPVSLGGAVRELLAWDLADGTTAGWLCLPPAPDHASAAHPQQRDLWHVLGGIVDRWNEPEDSWLLNHYDALTPELAADDPGESIAAYRWIWDQDGLGVPVEPREYGVLAVEANGNLTLCHRVTGEVLLFAPDHHFDYVEVLAGCPEYSLYRIPTAPDLRTWLETVAAQWLSALRT